MVQRLAGFRGRVEEIAAERNGRGSRSRSSAAARASRSTRSTSICRTGVRCIDDIALKASAGDALLVTGPSGSGKSTLLRAIAGLWPFGRGRIRVAEGRTLFLPQRPYLPLGTLADALAYPGAAAELPRDELADALRAVGLAASCRSAR